MIMRLALSICLLLSASPLHSRADRIERGSYGGTAATFQGDAQDSGQIWSVDLALSKVDSR